MKVLKHWPHFQRCQSLNSLLSWLVEVGLARTLWFLDPSGPKAESACGPPALSIREKEREQGLWAKTVERRRGAGDEDGLPFLLKVWRES